MEIVALLLLLVFAVLALTNLVCFIVVLIAMFTQEDSIIHGLIGLLCCNIYVLIWGFTKWQSKSKGLVMTLWILSILGVIGIQVILAVLGASIDGGGGGGY
jgi:hypothetical protein